MANAFGMKCPECGREGYIDVAARVWVRITRDGTSQDEAENKDTDWSNDSLACCRSCGYEGTVSDFED